MSELKITHGFASAPDIREKARRIVETSKGAFLIRKLEGMDFVIGGVKLPSGKKIDPQIQDEEKIKRVISEDMMNNLVAYYRVIIEKGVVSEKVVVCDDGSISYDLTNVPENASVVLTPAIVVEGEADTTKNEIMITDLSEEDRVKIISAIEEFNGLDAALEKRLENFRTKNETQNSSNGEIIRDDSGESVEDGLPRSHH